jgi:hypothetical protein
MKKYTLLVLLLSNLFAFGTSHANQSALQLGTCLTDSLNGKERKNLAKWIFLGMSSHNAIKPYSKVLESDFDESDKYIGTLITRLMTEDCPQQAKAAFQENGSVAIEGAFRIVGEVAMQELMTDQKVSQALGRFEKYVDQQKMSEILR